MIYVTANSLMSKDVPLESAVQIAKDAGADGFELRRDSYRRECNHLKYSVCVRN